MSNKTKRSARLVKKSQLIAVESLPAKTPEEQVKPTVINNLGESMMNFRRDEAAAKLGEGAGTLVQDAVTETSNKAMWVVEHVVADTAYLVAGIGEAVVRKTLNGVRTLGFEARQLEASNIEKMTASFESSEQPALPGATRVTT